MAGADIKEYLRNKTKEEFEKPFQSMVDPFTRP